LKNEVFFVKRRNGWQTFKDFITFPIRAFTLFEQDRWGFSSLQSERYYYSASAVQGYSLDVGCGRYNRFIEEFVQGQGKGIDIFPYEGLGKENLVSDLSRFPFEDSTFASVTFIANMNHIPRHQRNAEMAEAFRCLKPGGNIIATMGLPITELMAHKVVDLYDRYLGTHYDVDHIRGMKEGESLYISYKEIESLFSKAGFECITRQIFWTQWGLNSMYVGWKPGHAMDAEKHN
jgi:SAM-dependent methyltransferase